jgi:hypothetical protein
MATTSILLDTVRDELQRTVQREAEERYRQELLGDDERRMLWDRILRLRRELKLR